MLKANKNTLDLLGIIRKFGDQRLHYQQHLRAKQRISGDQQFYQNQNPSYQNNKYGYNQNYGASNYNSRVSGYGGRRPNGYGVHLDRYANSGSRLQYIDRSKIHLPHIRKNLYLEHATVTERNQAEIDEWLIQAQCTLQGKDLPRPIFDFTETGFPQPIIKHLSSSYQKPTAIQSITWPVALSALDMISIAKTGSGKTLGFILPAIVHVMNQAPRANRDGPTVLALLPTRELAIQVGEVAKQYCAIMGLSVTCCYGGAPKARQERDLFQGVDICIATPGRILDFLRNGTTNMKRCTYLTLDEADRMLDMGFEPQIREVIYQIHSAPQTLMFSATWPKEVHALASEFLRNPVHLNVGSLELAANHNIEQRIEVIEENKKILRLNVILKDIISNGNNNYRTLIFVGTKLKAEDLTRGMRRDGLPALCIHGDKKQGEREWVLGEFKTGKTQILIATDVAARGLDVDDIKFVINYDYPNNSEDYVHRIGRTGRCDKTGTAITFFTSENAPKARDLIKVLEEANQVVPPKLTELANSSSYNYKKDSSHFYGRRGGV